MKPVIYLATNTVTGDTYVGVTACGVDKRWREHRYSSRRAKPKSYLHRAIAKYGEDAFAVGQVASVLDPSHAGEVERSVIQSLQPTYNQTNGGEVVIGRRIPAEVAERIRQANIGKKRTDAQRRANSAIKRQQYESDSEFRAAVAQRLIEARKLIDHEKRIAAVREAAKAGRLSHKLSPERKAQQLANLSKPEAVAKMAASKRKPVECITLNTTFDSLLDAAAATGIPFGSISSVCIGRRNSVRGLVFCYVGAKNG